MYAIKATIARKRKGPLTGTIKAKNNMEKFFSSNEMVLLNCDGGSAGELHKHKFDVTCSSWVNSFT